MKTKMTHSVRGARIIGGTLKYAFLVAVLIITVFPLLYALTGSFKTNMEIIAEPGRIFPKTFVMDNYKYIFNSDGFNIIRLLFNSLLYTLVAVATQVMISSTAGYVFARGEFPGKKIVFACFTLLLFVKTGGMDVYPKMNILSALHLNKGLYALMILNLFGIPIVNIYLIKGFVQSLPKALDEAALLDGCGFVGTFFRILFPLLKPILATVAILAFQSSWNEYIMPAIFTANYPKQQTLIVGIMALKNSDGGATSWNLLLAGACIALVPVLFAYTVGNKYFVSGLAAGAVKG